MDYTEAQIADIKDREKKALDFLKAMNLTPAIQMYAVNVGNDTFAMKPVPYLQDLKYANPSPLKP